MLAVAAGVVAAGLLRGAGEMLAGGCDSAACDCDDCTFAVVLACDAGPGTTGTAVNGDLNGMCAEGWAGV